MDSTTPATNHDDLGNAKEGVRCSAWLGIAARTKASMQKVAGRMGLEIMQARWEPVRKGGIMCGPAGGWMVEVRAVGGKHRYVALGYNLAELYDDMHEAGRKVRYLDNHPRAGMPNAAGQTREHKTL